MNDPAMAASPPVPGDQPAQITVADEAAASGTKKPANLSCLDSIRRKLLSATSAVDPAHP